MLIKSRLGERLREIKTLLTGRMHKGMMIEQSDKSRPLP
jgi:hypothetical protein